MVIRRCLLVLFASGCLDAAVALPRPKATSPAPSTPAASALAKALEWPGRVVPAATKADKRAARGDARLRAALVDWCQARAIADPIAKEVGIRLPPSPAVFPPLATTQGNPFFATAMRLAREAATTKDERLVLEAAYAFAHPQSELAGDPALLTLVLTYLDDLFCGAQKKDVSGQFDILRPTRVYLLLRMSYPDLIPPTRRAAWEAGLRDLGNLSMGRTKRVLAAKPYMVCNLDSNDMVALADLGTALADEAFAARAKRICEAIALHQFEDGGIQYMGQAMPPPHYHSVLTRNMLNYWLLTGDPLAREVIVRCWWWWPLTLRPVEGARGRSIGLDITTVDWKKSGIYMNYNNRACASVYITAMVAGSGENRGLPDCDVAIANGALEDSHLLGAAIWRTDVKPVPMPSEYLVFDRNNRGPNGRFGAFCFVGNGRDRTPIHDEPSFAGKETYVGVMMAQQPGYALSAAGCDVQLRDAPLLDPMPATPIYEENSGFAIHHRQEVAAGSATGEVGGLSGSHLLTMAKIGDPEKGALPVRCSEAWVMTPRRIVGIMHLETEAPVQALALRARLQFTATERIAQPQERSPGTWQIGPIEVVIHHSTFAAKAQWRARDKELPHLELVDPEADRAGRKMRTYPAGTQHAVVVDIHPVGNGPAQRVQPILADGIVGLEFVDEKLGAYRMVANPTRAERTYAAKQWPGRSPAVEVISSETRHRPAWMDTFVFPFAGALTSGSPPDPAHAPQAAKAGKLSLRLKPGMHAIIRSP